jgi:hypothetical protein
MAFSNADIAVSIVSPFLPPDLLPPPDHRSASLAPVGLRPDDGRSKFAADSDDLTARFDRSRPVAVG